MLHIFNKTKEIMTKKCILIPMSEKLLIAKQLNKTKLFFFLSAHHLARSICICVCGLFGNKRLQKLIFTLWSGAPVTMGEVSMTSLFKWLQHLRQLINLDYNSTSSSLDMQLVTFCGYVGVSVPTNRNYKNDVKIWNMYIAQKNHQLR